jgi:rubrerythrin
MILSKAIPARELSPARPLNSFRRNGSALFAALEKTLLKKLKDNMADNKKFIQLLNLAFEKEYNDVFLYLREAELFKGKIVNGGRINEIFNGFSIMELRHADRVASHLIELGAAASWVFKPLESSTSLREVLDRHVENEKKAIMLYGELVNMCEDIDFGIILKGIKSNEQEHLEKVSHILKHLKAS